jgi:hypothetical protein
VFLTSLDWPFSAERAAIGDYAFNGCSSLALLNLPRRLETIGIFAFENCIYLREISLPQALTQIGNTAFKGCSSLRELSLPADLTQIGNYAFQNCISLRWVKWPVSAADAVLGTTTASNAFNGCTNLKKVELPDNLKTIYNNSFDGCTALRVVILRRSASPLTALNNANAFPVTTNTSLKFYVPDGTAVTAYQAEAIWSTADYQSKIVELSTLETADDPSNW